jgi:ABC-type transport system involved in cytochrome c biogenesis permease subunit
MKKYLPLLVLLAGLAAIAAALRPPANPGKFDVVGFSRLPLLVNGRVKPFDTVARTSLLVLQNRQRVGSPTSDFELTPNEWLLDVLFRGERADTYPTFAIDNPELLTLLNKTDENLAIQYTDSPRRVLALFGFLPSRYRRFAYQEIQPHFTELERQAKLADPVEPALRTPFQNAVLHLQSNLMLYQRLKLSLVDPDRPDFLGDLIAFQKSLEAGVAAVRTKEAGRPHDEAAARLLIDAGQRFVRMGQLGYLLAVPPADGEADRTGWRNAGSALLETFQAGAVNAPVLAYAGLAHTWRHDRPADFNEIVRLYRLELGKKFPAVLAKCAAEQRFNATEPFYLSMTFYAGAFFLALFSWLKWPGPLGKSAFYLTLLAWLLATAGIGLRMWLEGRPPVTNLYSSALFVGWGAVAGCLVLEKIFRNGVASVTAGLIGFATLLIAHHLSLGGDTLEMMRAVLDSNFWLATHVVVVTTGYAATFLAGFLALLYIIMGVFTPWLSRTPVTDGATVTGDTNARMLERMVYGIVCFATLFSLVGTILGGIWADQSWGRFWGWDPKENGALIIVIWNAVILHARWGGLVKPRGLMALAVFGNIVTSWSWFGVNMLGVGLHTYGFMESAFWWLLAFVASQLAFIALANLPLEKWRSFRA